MSERAEQNERLRQVVDAILTSDSQLPRVTILGRLSAALRPDGEAGVFGLALRARRHAAHMTLAELARIVDVSPTTMSNWETGKIAPPTARTQRRVFDLLAERANAG